MAKNVTNADIFGGMFRNMPSIDTADPHMGEGTGKKSESGRITVERSRLHPFKNHPFRVMEDEQMQELAESIRMYGIKEPILVRPDKEKEGEYEIISGHRRNYAAGLAGLNEVPAKVEDLNDDDAAVLMVDSNNKRETLLASEKAWAYRIKAEALRHQGKRNDLLEEPEEGMSELGQKNGDSERTVRRYIRLTYLLPELLALVDGAKMSVGMGYQISFFISPVQEYIAGCYEKQHTLPGNAQMEALTQLHRSGGLDVTAAENVLSAEKQIRQRTVNITLKNDRLKQYFPADATKEYMESVIVELLEQWSSQNK